MEKTSIKTLEGLVTFHEYAVDKAKEDLKIAEKMLSDKKQSEYNKQLNVLLIKENDRLKKESNQRLILEASIGNLGEYTGCIVGGEKKCEHKRVRVDLGGIYQLHSADVGRVLELNSLQMAFGHCEECGDVLMLGTLKNKWQKIVLVSGEK
jgi:RNA polymerase-binding transcription factor DksA